MATIVVAAGGGNWTSTATWTGGVVPTAADDVQLNNNSSVTINAAAFCRSLDCTGYTGTLTHAAGITLSIGDGTTGAGNIALKLVAGMTYTLGNGSTSAISFISTSATTQTITTDGKTLGSWTINGVGSSYQLADANTTSTLATVTLTAGSFTTNDQTCSWGGFNSDNTNTRSLTLGTSSITISGGGNGIFNVLTSTGLTFSAGSSTLIFSSGSGYLRSALTFGTVTWTVSGISQSQGFTCTNMNLNGTAVKTATFYTASNITVTGTLTIAGNSAVNRILVHSSTGGSARTITAANVAASNVDLQDITAAGAANWNLSAVTGNSGDCGGNSGITFTPSATQTWSGTSGGNWSANAWTSRVPLPQDDVSISSAFIGSQTITMDMPRSGRSVSFVGSSGDLTVNPNAVTTLFGSLDLTGLSSMGTSVAAWTFGGRGAYTLTSAGHSFAKPLTVAAPGGTYTMQDALTTTGTLSASGGTFNTNNNTVTAATLSVQNVGTICNIGSSTINITTTLNAYTILRTNSAAMTAGAATINIVNASVNERMFAATAVDFSNATLNYTVNGSTGALWVQDNLNIGTFNFSDASNARTLKILPARTLTVKNFNVSGTPGNLMSIASSTPGSTASVSKSSGVVNCDYLSIQDSTATGGASWYAGVNSANVSNNSGWFFQAYSPSKFLELL